MKTTEVFEYIEDRLKPVKPFTSRETLKAKKAGIAAAIRENKVNAGGRFLNVMMKISIVKLAAAMVTLIVMSVLLITHLDVFEPITLQFSRWVSSPIISLIVLIIIIKFAGLSIGLTITVMTVKKISFEVIRLRLMGFYRQGLQVLSGKRVQPQRA